MHKSETIEIKDQSFEYMQLSRDNYTQVHQWIDRIGGISVICHERRCVYISLNDEELGVHFGDYVVFYRNEIFILSEKGYKYFIATLEEGNIYPLDVE